VDEETLELNTNCTCTWRDLGVDDDEHGENEYPDCGGVVCWEPVVEAVDEATEAWLERNSSEVGYIITGANMGWQHRGGFKWWSGDYEDKPIRDLIGPRGEWTQRYRFGEKDIHINQSHHDAPTGESYKVTSAEGQVWVADEDDSDAVCGNCAQPYGKHIWSGEEYGPMLCDQF
jgi:hypothetical protein